MSMFISRMSAIVGLIAMMAISASAQTTIHYLGRGSEQERLIYEEIFEEFERQNPEINVEVDWGGGDVFWIFERLSIQIAAGLPPDVFWVHSFQTGDLASMGAVYPIDKLIQHDTQMDLDDYFVPPMNDFTFKGTLYALPRETSSLVLYYNQDMFDQSGIAYPDMSWNWDTIVETARRLTRRVGGEVQAYGLKAPTDRDAIFSTVWQNEGHVITEDRSRGTFSSSESVEAHEWVLSLMYEYEVAPKPGEPGGGIADFRENRLGMFYGIRGVAPQLSGATRWDVAHLPQGKTRATRIASSGHGIYAETEKLDESWALLKFLSGPFAQGVFARGGLSIPALREVAFSDLFIDPTKPPESDHIFVDALSYARPEPVTRGYLGLLGIWGAEMPDLWARTRTAWDVLSDIDRKVNVYLNQQQ